MLCACVPRFNMCPCGKHRAAIEIGDELMTDDTTRAAWQVRAIERVRSLLEAEDGVLALAVKGSCAENGAGCDEWSDVDLLVVVHDTAYDKYAASLDWLTPLYAVAGHEQIVGRSYSVQRVAVRTTDRIERLDLSIVRERDCLSGEARAEGLLGAPIQTLFARSPVLATALVPTEHDALTPTFMRDDFARLVNAFWHRAALAVAKVARNDLLIGTHLTLELARDCLVLAMVLRDREFGTTHHRTGGPHNDVVSQLAPLCVRGDASGVIDSIERCAVAFDILARQWDTTYADRREPLLLLLARAREVVRVPQ